MQRDKSMSYDSATGPIDPADAADAADPVNCAAESAAAESAATENAAAESKAAETASTWSTAAELLAASYAGLHKEAEVIRNYLDHPIVYTEDMAIRDLTQVTARTDKEAVQSSHISNQPESIVMKLEGGYVERMNRRLRYKADELSRRLVHICWKIGVVDAALNARTDNFHRQIFRRIFVKHRTYASVRNAYKGRLYNRNIAKAKTDILSAIEAELAMRACLPNEAYELEMLKRECRSYEVKREDRHETKSG